MELIKKIFGQKDEGFSPPPLKVSTLEHLPLAEHELTILNYVKPHKRVNYAEKLLTPDIKVYSNPREDIRLDKLEQLIFEPKDVILENRNWPIDVFGSEDDYAEFEKRRNPNVKFYIYQGDEYLDGSHPSFSGVNIVNKDFTNTGVNPNDGHGTFVASQYASSNKDHSPFPEIAKNQMTVLGATVLAGGGGDFNNIISFIDWAANDAKIRQQEGYVTLMNLSLGADADTPKVLSDALKRAKDAGILILAANGNSGLGRASTPANDDSVQGVMAISVDLTRANFSNVGPTTYFAQGGVMNYGADRNSGEDGYNNGTSFSSPFQVNAYLAAYSLYDFPNILEAENYLIEVTKDLGRGGKDNVFGYGLSLLQKILNTPYQDEPADTVIEVDLDDEVVTNNTTYRLIDGWEISWRNRNSSLTSELNTIFVEELAVQTNLSEADLKVELWNYFNDFKYTTTPAMGTAKIAKKVLQRFDKGTVLEALVDNNQDDSVQIEINLRKDNIGLI